MSEAEPLATGASIAGRYTVEAVRGLGGMATVYQVRDAKTGRALALKRCHAASPALLLKRRAMLEREYHTLAQLAHPLIIEVYDFGIDELGPFYTMELLDGADLQDGGRLPWRQACTALRDVASALAMLHARGFVHRDVSARNVRMTGGGSAKLLDFGTMTSMGVSTSVVGTPPFVSPEAMQMQSLDGRADLFALGALGYFLLTGRHAFPARRLGELRDVWRSMPVPVQRLLPEAPQALSALIERLLTLDRGARPQDAPEVIASLSAIAGLPPEERPGVSKAYLTTPRLVGRDAALLVIRKRMLSLVRGDGDAVLIEGESGSGRSRLLDACALEAKLVGATVLRASADDPAASGDFGVARTLCASLLEQLPLEVEEAASLPFASRLRGFLDSLSDEGASPPPLEQGVFTRELRDLVLAVARKRRLLVIVDDVDRIDLASAGLLAALAHKTERHALLLAVAAETGRSQMLSGALRLLRATAEIVTTGDLAPEHTEALLGSVFGDVANLRLIVARVHAISHGNPRMTLELAQHLVDRGLARYTAGAFSLPARLDEHDLPATLASSLAARLSLLGQDARELASILALVEEAELPVSDYAALTVHADPQRVFAALDELLVARIVGAVGDNYRFTQRGLSSVLAQLTSAGERARIHGLLAERLRDQPAQLLRRAHHLLAAGHELEGVELLCNTDLDTAAASLTLLERALACAEQRQMPARMLQLLRIAVLRKAPFVLAFESFRRTWPAARALFEQESGLAQYQELRDVPAGERLMQAVSRAQQRYEATPEAERAHDVVGALRQLSELIGTAISFGIASIDLGFLERLPDLTPFRPLSPAFDVVIQLRESAKHWVCGRFQHARAIQAGLLERIAQPDRSGLDESQTARLKHGLRFMMAQLDAAAGVDIEDGAALLELEPSMRASAWQLRQVFHLSQGDLDEARKCLRRSELLRLQSGSEQHLIGMTSTVELLAACSTRDLRGVRSALDAIALLAEESVGWKPLLVLGQCRYRELQGDVSGALGSLLPAFELAPPGRHLAYGMLASTHVNLLTQLGELDQAVAHGFHYREICEQLELHASPDSIQTALARALSAAGRHAEAMEVADRHIARVQEQHHSGVGMGALFELRARIALGVGDRAAFQHFASRCASEYDKSRNPALAARFARLVESAGEPGDDTLRALQPIVDMLTAQSDDRYQTVHSRMRECAGEAERARCALTLLLQDLESFSGHLYRVSASDPGGCSLQLLASVPEETPVPELTDWATDWISDELRVQTAETTSEDSADVNRSLPPAPGRGIYSDTRARSFAALPLCTKDDPRRVIALLVFELARGARALADRALVHELAAQLLS